MTIRDRQALRRVADDRLAAAAYDPRKLVFISSGVSFAVALLIAFINHILYRQVDLHTGGLAGMELRTALETAATALQYVQLIALPFWSMGMFSASLRIARSTPAEPGCLLDGFRRFGPVLRLRLLELLLYLLIGIACSYAGSFLFILTPFAVPLFHLMEPMLTVTNPEQMEALLLHMDTDALTRAMLPALVLVGILCFAVMLPVFYRLRMANFIIMDEPHTGALAAMLGSGKLMRKNRWQLFRLDLQFWPYYLLTALAMPLAYTDQLLPLLGISLPVSDDALFFLGYGAYILASLALHLWMLHRVQTTYAVTYDTLKENLEHV